MGARSRLMLLLLSVGLFAPPAAAEPPAAGVTLRGETEGKARRLEAVDKLVSEGQWTPAVDEYVRLLGEGGDDLAPVGPAQAVQVRRLCHLRLAAAPPAALRAYRDQADRAAKKWWDQAEAARDVTLLRRIVDEAFCSRVGDLALDRLGDLAFERGELNEADHWWRLLSPLPTEVRQRQEKKSPPGQLELLFPDPQIDLARVRAKQVLTLLMRGGHRRFEEEFGAFAVLHPRAEGSFAGNSGNYRDRLRALARDPKALAAPQKEPPWTTFAGDPSRQFRIPGGPSKFLFEGAVWTAQLPARITHIDAGQVLPASAAARALVFHPVIADGQVLVADAAGVTRFDLLSGERTGRYDLGLDPQAGRLDPELSLLSAETPHTLTVADGRAYARLGSSALPSREATSQHGDSSVLVCLDLRAPDGLPVYWRALPQEGNGESAYFEGAPVVHAGRAYVARVSFTGVRAATAIDCYSAATGARRWRSDVCEAPQLKNEGAFPGSGLLTLAGPNVAYCSQSGAIVAVDALTGRHAWAVRYSSRGGKTTEGDPSPRDLAPPLYADGRLFVAPADADRILCLDPDTGRLLWESPRIEVVQILGVADGKLIVTTGSRPRGIRALNAATGTFHREWLQPDDGLSELPTFGRGLLADGKVFWPTLLGLRVLDQETGQPDLVDADYLHHRLGERGGNLAFGEGCLAIAGANQLWVFVPPGRRLERARKDAANQPRSAPAYFRLGLAEADRGLLAAALASSTRAEQLAGPTELGDLARHQRHARLLDLAEREQAVGRTEAALTCLHQAAGADFSGSERFRARQREAELWGALRRPEKELAVWQQILEDDALRECSVLQSDRTPESAGASAAERIARLLQHHGRALYAPVEERARAALATAGATERAADLRRVAQAYPNAVVVGSALTQLALLEERRGNDGAAAEAYRALLRARLPEAERTRGLTGLARAYERQHCASAAHAVWQRLGADSGTPVRRALDFPLPLAKSWEIDLAPGERLLVPDGAIPPGSVFVTLGERLTCRESATGRIRWTRRLAFTPTWLALYTDRLLAAGGAGIACLSLANGVVWWRSPALQRRDGPALLAPRDLGHFQLVGDSLVVLQENERLLVYDADTGRVRWQHFAPGALVRPLAPGGRWNSRFFAGDLWLVAQSALGQRFVLDTRDGRLLQATSNGAPVWPRPPLAFDARHVCLVADARRLTLLEMPSGREVWTQDVGSPSVSGQPPQVWQSGADLYRLADGWRRGRVSLSTGETPNEWLLDTEPVDLRRAAWDSATLYLVTRGSLHASNLADGRHRWDLPLPGAESPCRVQSHRGLLFVCPDEAAAPLRWSLIFGPQADVFPFFGTHALTVPVAFKRRDFPVWICQPTDGRLLQQLHFDGAGPGTMQLLDQGVVVSLGGKVWGMRAPAPEPARAARP